jgi:TPR repeat protein
VSATRRLPFVLLIAAVVACRRAESTPASDLGALLRSTDRVAVYDAGVAAYRAKDYAVARRLWERASELGDREAAANVGYLLYHGFGGPPDSAGALRRWREAMRAGDAEAHRHVADAALNGDARFGTVLDAYAHAVAADLLARRPGELGGESVAADARRIHAELDPKLTPAQRDSAARRGRDFAADTVVHVLGPPSAGASPAPGGT